MKTFRYNEYTEAGNIVITMNEDEIIDSTWDYWFLQMCQAIYKPNCNAFGRPWLIIRQNCIDDWVVTNWAEEL